MSGERYACGKMAVYVTDDYNPRMTISQIGKH